MWGAIPGESNVYVPFVSWPWRSVTTHAGRKAPAASAVLWQHRTARSGHGPPRAQLRAPLANPAPPRQLRADPTSRRRHHRCM